MSDFEARIEKYFEGTSLGLAAVADVLSKMDDRFEKSLRKVQTTIWT